jgi:hypothetical protein
MSFSSPVVTRLMAAAACFFAMAAAGLVSIPTYAADLKQKTKIAPGLPASSDPSGAAAVDRLLNPHLADPSVPLPTPNLSERADADQPLQKPQIYGRGEQGGQNGSVLEGIVGVRIPFPAPRGTETVNTTYSSSEASSQDPIRGR